MNKRNKIDKFKLRELWLCIKALLVIFTILVCLTAFLVRGRITLNIAGLFSIPYAIMAIIEVCCYYKDEGFGIFLILCAVILIIFAVHDVLQFLII